MQIKISIYIIVPIKNQDCRYHVPSLISSSLRSSVPSSCRPAPRFGGVCSRVARACRSDSGVTELHVQVQGLANKRTTNRTTNKKTNLPPKPIEERSGRVAQRKSIITVRLAAGAAVALGLVNVLAHQNIQIHEHEICKAQIHSPG